MNNPLLEPLTRREHEILDQLAEGLTSREMAERLTLAVSSVRWYIQQIYGKLGVNSKRQAITRAGELGLLQSEGLNSAIIKKTNPNNLPAQLTSFIGRETEITTLRHLITAGSTRLVTLTGSGGVGKTRLAIRTAEELLGDFADGIWLVELAPLADPELVALAAATALCLPPDSGETSTQLLCDHLRNKHLLLILDNCEHVVSATAELVDSLLRTCPRLCILATSREILGVSGETPFRCPSLSLPDPDHLPPLPELSQSEAIRLFTERAQTTSTGFSLTEANAALIIQICQRLDGIPLAIELAAARVRVMAPQQIAARLDNVFRLLTAGSRNVLPRQQTLKATIDWSYDLLSERERLALQLLSVFAGSWTLESAEAIVAGEDIEAFDVLDVLTNLVDKSLAQTIRSSEGLNRYRMLETVRQYAHDRLLETGAGELVRNKHLSYYLELALRAELNLRGIGQRVWSDRLDEELDNIRLALEWAISSDIEKGLQLATALERFWHIRNYWMEGTGWLDRLLEAEAGAVADSVAGGKNQPRQTVRSIVRGKALNVSGGIWIDWLENNKALPLLEEARDIFREHGDLSPRDLAISMGNLAFIEKDLDRAITGAMQAVDLLRKEEDNSHLSRCLHFLANLNVAKGDLVEARTNSEECLALSREAENVDREARSLGVLGCLELISGNSRNAAVLFGEAQSCFDTLGSRIYSVSMMNLQAHVAMSQGNYLHAIQCSEAALAVSVDMNNKVLLMNANSFLAWEAWALENYDRANQQCDNALALSKGLRPRLAIIAKYILGRLALSLGEYSQADVHLKELIVWLNEKSDPFWINFVWSPYGFKGMNIPTCEAINAMGVLANAQHQARRAATLFGAQDALCHWLKNTLSLAERNEYEQALVSAHVALGEKTFTTAWEEGRAMSLDQTVQYALG